MLKRGLGWNPGELTHIAVAVEDPGQLRMGRHLRLHIKNRFDNEDPIGVHDRTDPLRDDQVGRIGVVFAERTPEFRFRRHVDRARRMIEIGRASCRERV